MPGERDAQGWMSPVWQATTTIMVALGVGYLCLTARDVQRLRIVRQKPS
jgi:hypothetical protein